MKEGWALVIEMGGWVGCECRRARSLRGKQGEKAVMIFVEEDLPPGCWSL